MKHQELGMVLLVILLTAAAAAAAQQNPSEGQRSEARLPVDVYPADAFTVPVENRDGLQQALDTHHIVRLLPGDYGPGPVTLQSGQQLYGLPGTKLGRIVISPGATGVLVSMIQGNVQFPASDTVTKGNTILRTYGEVNVQGGSLEDNLIIDTRSLKVDVTSSGYLRNNRFIRAPGQIQGNNMVMFHADPDRPSTGNVFLWLNSGAPNGPTTDIAGVPDLTFAAVDAEMWSCTMKQPTALFVTGSMERLTLFAVQGGRYDTDPEFRKQFGLVDSGAKEVRIYGLTCGYRGQPPDTLPAKINLHEGNERSLVVDSLHYSYSIPSTSLLNVRAFEQRSGTEGTASASQKESAQSVLIEPAGAEKTRLAALKDMILQTGRQLHPWDRPAFDQVPDPAGRVSAREAAAAPDQTKMLQDRLDKEGMAILPAGRFFISAPLRINRDKGLIGAGMGRTVIIAKDPAMSMFEYDPQGATRGVTLANLTLQGGRVGVHLRGEDIGDTPINNSFMSHITFRNFSEAGIFVDMAGQQKASFDNNLISFCNFVQCGAGLKQNPARTGGWGFIDKLVAYRCQFLQCGIAIDFPASRANNCCSYIDCLFKGNTESAARLKANTTTTFANCEFIENGGNPVVSSDMAVNFLSCHFTAGSAARSLLPSRSIAEGCVFEPGISKDAVVVRKPAQTNHFYNCRLEMPVGQLNDSMLLNNQFNGRAELSQIAAYVLGGKPSVVVPGISRPGPQILVTGKQTGRSEK